MSVETKIAVTRWLLVAVAPFSVLGSMAVLVCIARHEVRRNNVNHRLMIGMSIHDFLASLGMALGSVPIPANIGFDHAYGTQATCTAQAFFVNLATVSYMYAASLSVYFVLFIRYKLRDDYIAKYIEPILHFLPLGWGYTQALVSWQHENFNPLGSGTMCWIAPYPPNCQYVGECTRGTNFEHDLLTLHTIPGFINYGILFACLAVVVFTVRSVLRKSIQIGSRRSEGVASPNDVPIVDDFDSTLLASHASYNNPSSNFPLPASTGASHIHAVTAFSTLDEDVSESRSAGDHLFDIQDHSEKSQNDHALQRDSLEDSTVHSIEGGRTMMMSTVDQQQVSTSTMKPSTTKTIHQRAVLTSLHQRNLNLAVVQCLCYGLAYLFCLTWTTVIAILDLRGKDAEFMTRYYWVRTRTHDHAWVLIMFFCVATIQFIVPHPTALLLHHFLFLFSVQICPSKVICFICYIISIARNTQFFNFHSTQVYDGSIEQSRNESI
jgi:hypothetical protein